MSIINSNELTLKNFQLIKILPNDSNYKEIMRFCGWNEKQIEQEIILHTEGNPTLIGNQELCERDGDFVVKWDDGTTEIISASCIGAYVEF